jgi:hypothetical protein
VPLEKPTDVLADRAEQLIASLGYTDPAVDRARGFTVSAEHQRWAQRHGPANWWPVLRSASPPALLFWYRTSPRDLVPTQPASTVTSTDPPSLVSGMRLAIFDTRGRLVEFHSVPPQLDADATPAPAPNWRTLFEAASLDPAAFAPVTPQWTPREFADTRAAWQGPLPDRANLVVRVEAAAYRGRPVSFAVIGDWTQPAQMQAAARTPLQSALSAINVAMYLMVLCGAALLARYNLRARRADSQGAARLAIGLTLMETLAWTFGAHHVGTPDIELRQVMSALAFTTYLGAVVWVLYLAIEPYARRFWPDGLLGWTRLLSGRVRDPRVGRDVLIGLLLGIGMIWLEAAGALLPQVWGYTASLPPFGKSVAPLASDVVVLTQWITRVYGALQTALYVAMIFTVLRLLLRRAWMAIVAGILVLLALTDGGRAFTGTWFDTAVQTCTIALAAYATFRHGLLVLAIMVFTDSVATNLPLTLHGSAWWAATSNLTIALFIGLAAFGFYAARAGQPLFGMWNSEFGIRNS